MKFKKSFGGREKYKSVKYRKDLVGDCVIRAISNGLNQDYKHTFQELLNLSWEMLILPNSWKCVEEYLTRKGWTKNKPMRNSRNRKLKVGQFPMTGVYLIQINGHFTCLKDGVLLDTWDCRKSSANSYYTKPNLSATTPAWIAGWNEYCFSNGETS